MRTTIVIDDILSNKLKTVISQRGLSEFINLRLQEYFDKQEKIARLKKLEAAYERAASQKGKGEAEEFDALDREDWPEW